MIAGVLSKLIQVLLLVDGTLILATLINSLILAIDPLADRHRTTLTAHRRTGAGSKRSFTSLSYGFT